MRNYNLVNTLVECGVNMSQYDNSDKVNPTLFRNLVGDLRYLTYTKPYICFGIKLISHYLEKPTKTHSNATKESCIILKVLLI